MAAKKNHAARKKAAAAPSTPPPSRTPTALAPAGALTAQGVSPSGFTLSHTYKRPDAYQATRGHRPSFLNVLPASEAPCLDCTAYCCRARVVINVPDLLRLCVPLGIHPSSLCNLEEADSRNGEPILIGDTPRHMVLRKAEDEHCQLLMTVDGQRRCGVHAIRPGICRVYPFSYQRGSTVYQLGHVMCPTEWLLSAERQDKVLDDVEAYEQARAVDRRVVRRFNALPLAERGPLAFWTFALREGGAELNLDVGLFLNPKPRTLLRERLW